MAINITKYTRYVPWDEEGVGASRRSASGGAVTIDLSQYYTISQLQTIGQSEILFDNLIEAYHNKMLGLQGGKVITDSSGTPSSEGDDEFYHLDEETYTRVITWEFLDSLIEESDGTIHLINDEDHPGILKYYGTDETGTKGWHELTKGFQTASFAATLNIDCTTYKDWICTVTDDCTVNINNLSDGDAGMLELIIDGSSSGDSFVITFGAMWTKKMGPTDFDGSDGADNIISWRAIGDGSEQEIIYTIGVIEV
jgi:hypothetical protein